MAIYHCAMQVIGRSSNRRTNSAVAAAAYRSGSQIYDEWRGKNEDYRRKKEVVYSEIMLPDNAPEAFKDRATLWNSVELFETRKNAQLAREIEVSLPVELDLDEHIKIIHDYCEPFRAAGMCVDFNIHQKPNNPHCHIMLTLRPLNEHGQWMPKGKLVYDLDENGERIRLPSGKWKSHKEPTVDWSEQGKAEEWRAAWADVVNRHLEMNGFTERIDHRSNADRGIEEIPTIHMGPAACAMEKKGIPTERGDINRQIKAANKLIKEIRTRINDLKDWLSALTTAMKEVIEEAKSPSLADLMVQYMELESQRVQKYSPQFRLQHTVSVTEDMRKSLDELNADGIYTLDDLEKAIAKVKDKSHSTQQSVRSKERRMKELEKMIDQGKQYQTNLPVRKQYNAIKRQKKKDAFEEANRAEMILWNTANRFLHANHIEPDTLPVKLKEWKDELLELTIAHNEQYEELKEIREEVDKLNAVHRQVEKVLTPEQDRKKAKSIER
ncbi:MAG: MobA/MobL family protein [Clostridiales bacterium]|nr:MobA/MobL family protein [Clostridiales bacterium]